MINLKEIKTNPTVKSNHQDSQILRINTVLNYEKISKKIKARKKTIKNRKQKRLKFYIITAITMAIIVSGALSIIRGSSTEIAISSTHHIVIK
jgi:hypothetical protein